MGDQEKLLSGNRCLRLLHGIYPVGVFCQTQTSSFDVLHAKKHPSAENLPGNKGFSRAFTCNRVFLSWTLRMTTSVPLANDAWKEIGEKENFLLYGTGNEESTQIGGVEVGWSL